MSRMSFVWECFNILRIISFTKIQKRDSTWKRVRPSSDLVTLFKVTKVVLAKLFPQSISRSKTMFWPAKLELIKFWKLLYPIVGVSSTVAIKWAYFKNPLGGFISPLKTPKSFFSTTCNNLFHLNAEIIAQFVNHSTPRKCEMVRSELYYRPISL